MALLKEIGWKDELGNAYGVAVYQFDQPMAGCVPWFWRLQWTAYCVTHTYDYDTYAEVEAHYERTIATHGLQIARHVLTGD